MKTRSAESAPPAAPMKAGNRSARLDGQVEHLHYEPQVDFEVGSGGHHTDNSRARALGNDDAAGGGYLSCYRVNQESGRLGGPMENIFADYLAKYHGPTCNFC